MNDHSEDSDELEEEIEGEITEEGEMLSAIRAGNCYYCGKPQNSCSHLIAVVDRTFGTLEQGPLSALLKEVEQSFEQSNMDDIMEKFCEQLMYLTSWVNYKEDTSDRPMSASRMTYFWGDLSEAQTELRKRFL
jgi:hypothetical protein